MTNTNKCPDCLAHNSPTHKCDGLMKMLVDEHNKNTRTSSLQKRGKCGALIHASLGMYCAHEIPCERHTIPSNAQRTGDMGRVEDTSIEDAIVADRKVMLGEIGEVITHNCEGECWEEIKLLFKRMS